MASSPLVTRTRTNRGVADGESPRGGSPASGGRRQLARQLPRRSIVLGGAFLATAAAVIVPGTTSGAGPDHRPRIVATTGILADLARQVAGDDAVVVQLVPDGADPHGYEPSARAVRDIAYADLALSNYLMLEEQSLIRTIDANLAPGVEHVALAEEASVRGAEVIPLVENRALDTVWLGLRVIEDPAVPRERTAQTAIRMTACSGPGQLHGFVTGTFGQPDSVFDSSDGSDAADEILLPPDAHTHMSWAFTEAGLYEAEFSGVRVQAPGEARNGSSSAVLRGRLMIVVGTSPADIPQVAQREVIDRGHADLTVDFSTGTLGLRVDSPDGPVMKDLDDVVVHVGPQGLLPVPSDPAFRFIARPGSDVYQLPQAVLGRHVHGEIDPHLWQDVTNAQAYVEVIRDRLLQLDPEHAAGYAERTDSYLRELDELDTYVMDSVASIPKERRNLVTTHDAYGYLAARYGMTVAGTVAPAPGQEPSIADRRRLAITLRDLQVPAVFVEQVGSANQASLRDAAQVAGVAVCPIWSDAFIGPVTSYVTLMRANADSLARGLGGTPQGTHDQTI